MEVMDKKSLGLVLCLVLAVTLTVGCHRRNVGCFSPTEPGCGGGDTAQIHGVELVDVPPGGVAPLPGNSDGRAQILVWLTLDFPDSQMIQINTAASKSRDVLTDSMGGKQYKSVALWKKEGNPVKLVVVGGTFGKPSATYNYIHVLVFKGSGPESWEVPRGRDVSIATLRNLVAHMVLEQEVTFLSDCNYGCS